MDLFLDTCIIVGYHTDSDVDDQHDVVMKYLEDNGIDLENNVTTCEKVREEVDGIKYKIRREYKRQKKLSSEKINNKIQQIDRYFDTVVRMVNYSDKPSELYNRLFSNLLVDIDNIKAELDDEVNSSDVEIFSNSIIWALENQIDMPVFLTTDNDDYNICDKNGHCVPLCSVKNCMQELNHEFNIPFELLILRKFENVSYSLNK